MFIKSLNKNETSKRFERRVFSVEVSVNDKFISNLELILGDKSAGVV